MDPYVSYEDALDIPAFLKLHNKLRSLHGAGGLKWDVNCAACANKRLADDVLTQQGLSLASSSTFPMSQPPSPSNQIWWARDGEQKFGLLFVVLDPPLHSQKHERLKLNTLTLFDALEFTYERSRSSFDFSRRAFQKEHAAFTQLIWRNSKFVGAALREMDNGAVAACLSYYPAGNSKFRFSEYVAASSAWFCLDKTPLAHAISSNNSLSHFETEKEKEKNSRLRIPKEQQHMEEHAVMLMEAREALDCVPGCSNGFAWELVEENESGGHSRDESEKESDAEVAGVNKRKGRGSVTSTASNVSTRSHTFPPISSQSSCCSLPSPHSTSCPPPGTRGREGEGAGGPHTPSSLACRADVAGGFSSPVADHEGAQAGGVSFQWKEGLPAAALSREGEGEERHSRPFSPWSPPPRVTKTSPDRSKCSGLCLPSSNYDTPFAPSSSSSSSSSASASSSAAAAVARVGPGMKGASRENGPVTLSPERLQLPPASPFCASTPGWSDLSGSPRPPLGLEFISGGEEGEPEGEGEGNEEDESGSEAVTTGSLSRSGSTCRNLSAGVDRFFSFLSRWWQQRRLQGAGRETEKETGERENRLSGGGSGESSDTSAPHRVFCPPREHFPSVTLSPPCGLLRPDRHLWMDT
uniref:Uncharacterized protein n=1 Tax=Chromera velia CCMP2878 TaxID=1169474 RepID=A0A0G4F9C0_9ALVE|eukprot:Cvel_15878.t1-p1 / transcript=Cvel_15878.t1 / gene=Cvel_15878 / organism=Chromera_velia_CCMP2878 / gene_product=hypothetical protein / transcript_product=hypothetical protein / location=Cvel_scaffold1198:18600-20815(-) / protein_length=637 / sequence_SO=supercontig / SO=protein_coding / is_pseudo=false